MTEPEAKTKWCPFTRQTYHEYGAYNRQSNGAPLDTCCCIGSQCMAWRWSTERSTLRRMVPEGFEWSVEEPPRPDELPASWEWQPADEAEGDYGRWYEPVAEADARRHGYCGLAGAPAT